MSKKHKKKLQKEKQLAIVLSVSFMFIALCSGIVAFVLRNKGEKEQNVIQNIQQEIQVPENIVVENQQSKNEIIKDDENEIVEEIPEEDEVLEENPDENESEIPEELPENNDETQTEIETETEDEVVENQDVPVSFNKPDEMRGVVVNAGVDFFTDVSKSDDLQKQEIDAMIKKALNLQMNTLIVPLITENGSVFSVESMRSISSFDALEYLISAARQNDLFIYGIYDLSLAADDGEIIQLSLKNTENSNLSNYVFKEFIKKYDLDAIILDGCDNPENTYSYADYMNYGSGRSYDEYLKDNSEMFILSVKELREKYNRNTQIGLLTDAVWAKLSENEGGLDVNSQEVSSLSRNLDSKKFVDLGILDFVLVENFTSTKDTAQSFTAVAKWWDNLAASSQLPIYMLHAADRACTNNISAGWAAYDQLTRQLIALEDCPNLQGSAFKSLSNLVANPQGSTTLLLDYFSDNVKKEHILKELAFSKPTQLNISTNDKSYTFQGASDPNSPVTVGGEKIATDENGFFSYTVDLQPGENKFTFSHKAKTMTFTINRQVQVIKEVNPTGSLDVDGGMKVTVTAVAYENSTVMVSLNGQNYPMSVDQTTGDEELRGTSYQRYTGSFIVPKATKEEQHLGNLKITATWEGITQSAQGASVTVNKLAIVEDGVLVRVTANQAIVFPIDEIGPYPSSKDYRLPKGTLDYAVGEEVIYKNGDDIRKYYKLASGMRVYSSDISAVSDSSLYVANNKISGMTVKADNNYTYVILQSEQPVPFVPSYNNTKFSIDFKYTSSVTENIASLTKNPLFSSATWNGTTLTLALKTQGAFLGYKAYHQDGTIVFRFNNPTTIKGANIVVDPGHGGVDNGAPGFNPNYQEKHINWAIAKKLASELESKGANVLLLNTINTTMDMDTRLAKAQAFNAQVYISVHNNSAANSSATGTEIYYFYPFAQPLASKLSPAISSALNTNNRGAKFGVYYVTRDPQFVGILSECGFMSNNKEYKKLIDSKYQNQIAEGMASAIASFLKAAGSGNIGLTGTQSVGGEIADIPQENPGTQTENNSGGNSAQTSGLTFKNTEATLNVGEFYEVEYTLSDDLDEDDIVWESSDDEIIVVGEYGEIKAIAEGEATVYAEIGDYNAEIKITVIDESAIEPEGDEENSSEEKDEDDDKESDLGENSKLTGEGFEIEAPAELKVGKTVILVAYNNGEVVEDVKWFMYEYSQQFASLSSSGKLTAEKAAPITVMAELPDGTRASAPITIIE